MHAQQRSGGRFPREIASTSRTRPVRLRRATLNSSESFFNRHLRTDSDSEVLLNVFADEIHRAHQNCIRDGSCDPNARKVDFVFEAAEKTMRLLEGSYSCICLIKGVGLTAFRDPFGIRPLVLGRR